MKKLLGLSLVCALFLAMLSIPTTAEARNYRISNVEKYSNGGYSYTINCQNGAKYRLQYVPNGSPHPRGISTPYGYSKHCASLANDAWQRGDEVMVAKVCGCNWR